MNIWTWKTYAYTEEYGSNESEKKNTIWEWTDSYFGKVLTYCESHNEQKAYIKEREFLD
jgi:hypothetical protein